MIEKSGWNWTPQDIAAIPIPQLLALFGHAGVASSGALDLAEINRKRAAKGLKPLTKIPGLGKL